MVEVIDFETLRMNKDNELSKFEGWKEYPIPSHMLEYTEFEKVWTVERQKELTPILTKYRFKDDDMIYYEVCYYNKKFNISELSHFGWHYLKDIDNLCAQVMFSPQIS